MLPTGHEAFTAGMSGLGASASNDVSRPMIKTTSDIPIVQSLTFDAFESATFQINTHDLDRNPGSSTLERPEGSPCLSISKRTTHRSSP